MTDTNPYARLLDHINSDSRHVPTFIGLAMKCFPQGHANALLARNGSFNAARALHDAEVPGWVVETISQCVPRCQWYVAIREEACEGEDYLPPEYGDFDASGHGENPGLSWLIAILKVKAAVLGDQS